MKRTGTMTPDGKGGFNIELNEPKKGIKDFASEAVFHVGITFFTVITSWAVGKGLNKLG